MALRQNMDLVIRKTEDGIKVDLAIHSRNLGISRRKIRKLLDEGRVQVNQRRIRYASYRVKHGDKITLAWKPTSTAEKTREVVTEPWHVDTLHQSDHIFAFNKPAGVLSERSGREGLRIPSLLELVQKPRNVNEGQASAPLRLCHRLDKETSGVIVVARTHDSCEWIGQQFKQRQTEKVYHALCYGIPKKGAWNMKCHLSPIQGKSGRVERRFSGGKISYTEFRVLRINRRLGLSLIECRPETGRSHQIRIHLELSGFPIVGDKKYGEQASSNKLPASIAELSYQRHYLHAKSLKLIPSPGDAPVTFDAPYPQNFEQILHLSKLNKDG